VTPTYFPGTAIDQQNLMIRQLLYCSLWTADENLQYTTMGRWHTDRSIYCVSLDSWIFSEQRANGDSYHSSLTR